MAKGEKVTPLIKAAVDEAGEREMPFDVAFTAFDDPRRLAFVLPRYKWVAKMLEGQGHVLEVGCAGGFFTRLVRQAVGRVTAIDFDPTYIASAKATMSKKWPIEFREHDVMEQPVEGSFDAMFALDVLEHIHQKDEEHFLRNALHGLKPHGVCIIGMPSLESQEYASANAKMGHVNCKPQPVLKALMQKFFHNVFMFAGNDEIIHTGYSKMAHYNLALCCGRK